ncbi:uncharacterized protein LOC114127079 [Aphis gossypii]|uniref:Deltamethrin resistance protein prag01 domain-containing protein n=1 Tax=Aphis gossypii TaxID=80765 RepID=A0A9P0IRX2_APHGO|nr:uncharacterized protein LOC114127079 [Aphis gossypii]CAH1713862.1 unnamed protein product [Aphis gossypii]
MFRKLILAQSKLFRHPIMVQNPNVLHLRGKKDTSKQTSKETKQDTCKPVYECICPPIHYRILTMDDMQLPYGNWKEQYTKRNKSYNKILLFGLVSLIGSIIVLKESLFFNAVPPPYPFDKISIFECADDDEDCELECECEC